MLEFLSSKICNWFRSVLKDINKCTCICFIFLISLWTKGQYQKMVNTCSYTRLFARNNQCFWFVFMYFVNAHILTVCLIVWFLNSFYIILSVEHYKLDLSFQNLKHKMWLIQNVTYSKWSYVKKQITTLIKNIIKKIWYCI